MLRSLKIFYAETAEFKMRHNKCGRKEFFNFSLGDIIILLSAFEGCGGGPGGLHVMRETMAEISRVLWMTSASITGTVDTMEEFEMARRIPDPEDKRKKLLKISQDYVEVLARFVRNVGREARDPAAKLEFKMWPSPVDGQSETAIKSWQCDGDAPELQLKTDSVVVTVPVADFPDADLSSFSQRDAGREEVPEKAVAIASKNSDDDFESLLKKYLPST